MTIPASVTSIGEGAFEHCNKLKAINVSGKNPVYSSSDGVLYTDDQKTLLKCPEGKRSVAIPDSVVRIADGNQGEGWNFGPFANCEKLKTVKLPASLEYIGKYAFASCGLKSITVPAKVRAIVEAAFFYCKKLQKVTLPDGLTLIGEYAFCICKSLKNVTIPDGVTSIGEGAFCRCSSLTSVTIPRSVTKIGVSAFHMGDGEGGDGIPLNVTIYGYKGSYAETYAQKKGFAFSALPDPVSLAKAKITVSAQVYTGKALKPEVKVVLKGKTLKKGADYTVSYKNNKAIGTATVTVAGKGDYKGTAKATFKINPKAVTGLKLTAGKGKLTASWKKSAGGVGGYQLQYALKKNFSGAKKVTVSKASTLKATLKKLKAGKIYYVRIRTYKKVGKTTYWSAWSEAKKAKVK